MVDYTDYFSFELPEDAGPGVKQLHPQDIETVGSALQQLMQTRRGRQLIEQAAEQSPDGKIHITTGDAYPTSARAGGILNLSRYEGDVQYRGEDGMKKTIEAVTGKTMEELEAMPEAEALELITESVAESQRQAYEEKTGYWYEMEKETVDFTNRYMRRFYNEVPRAEYYDDNNYGQNPESPLWDNNGSNFSKTPRWLRSNFSSATGHEQGDIHAGLSQDPSTILASFENVDPQTIANFGPEVASLYEVRTSPEHFNAAMESMQV